MLEKERLEYSIELRQKYLSDDTRLEVITDDLIEDVKLNFDSNSKEIFSKCAQWVEVLSHQLIHQQSYR